MSEVFFNQMDIPKPHYNHGVKRLSHGSMKGKMLAKTEEILAAENPDWVFVYSDTNATIAIWLAANKIYIKVAHREAGLRTFNMCRPQEVYRILSDHISDTLFCPTETAIENLVKEGYDSLTIFQIRCGDVMYVAPLYYAHNACKSHVLNGNFNFVLSTVYRQVNKDEKQNLLDILDALGEIYKELKVILPLHPRTTKKLSEFNILPSENIKILDPVGYFEMIWLLKIALMLLRIVVDFKKKPCIAVREETEWIELIKHKVNFITVPNKNKILDTFNNLKNVKINFDGTGNTCEEIVSKLIAYHNSELNKFISNGIILKV